MERNFGQRFDSDERCKGLQEDAFNESETTQHDLSKNLESCTAESDSMEEEYCENLEASEPYVGMEFKSREDAREFYVSYGRRTGFSVRIHHNRRSRINEEVISQDYVCSKEGFRAKKYVERKDRVLPPPPITREGCRAMIRVTLRDGGKWVVTKFMRDHSHKLMSPAELPWRRSDKILLTEDEKDKKIRELTIELYNEKRRCERRCAAYQEQLQMVLKDIETHTEKLSSRVQDIVQSIKEIEEE
ncbi:hypothetical protein Syun_030355 [Stephania yunnanensis]|uniref:FAR1 domain-containing protein n=1 Tax=Stephania yunnanensis TaxID=152371 RepID=A0AAP0HKQ5_9MAGN